MPATYVNIASQTLGANAASVTFSSIPATYTDLVLRMSVRQNYPSDFYYFQIRINSITSGYSYTSVSGDGSTASSGRNTGLGFYRILSSNANTSTSNTFSNHEFYIPNYNSSTNKPALEFSASETNATTAVQGAVAHLMSNTAAISSITILNPSTYNFVTGSSFYLYGIKNS